MRAGAVAPTVFGRLPRASLRRPARRAVQGEGRAVRVLLPADARRRPRPGIYYVNTYDLPSRTYSKLASTTFHEAIPGHHFQIALEVEHPTLNVFRRLGARITGAAFVEGWGLYAERLADELGLYRNHGERLGMLDAQAWRASRLIVDSGMHGLGWSRQQSIDWLLKTGLSETDAVIETDRYIVWPGQALIYMTGMREIRRLRRELEARDGDRVRPQALPRRAHRARVAAAGDAGPRAAALGDAGGLTAAPRPARPRTPAGARRAAARAVGEGLACAARRAPADASMAVDGPPSLCNGVAELRAGCGPVCEPGAGVRELGAGCESAKRRSMTTEATATCPCGATPRPGRPERARDAYESKPIPSASIARRNGPGRPSCASAAITARRISSTAGRPRAARAGSGTGASARTGAGAAATTGRAPGRAGSRRPARRARRPRPV